MSKSKSLSSKVLINMVSIFASRVFGLARDIACSSYWGATEGPQAAFNTAFAIPNMLRMLFGEGAFNAAFVPMIAGKLKDGVAMSMQKVKSTMCNCGATTISELQQKANLTLVSSTSIVEGGAHDVVRKQ